MSPVQDIARFISRVQQSFTRSATQGRPKSRPKAPRKKRTSALFALGSGAASRSETLTASPCVIPAARPADMNRGRLRSGGFTGKMVKTLLKTRCNRPLKHKDFISNRQEPLSIHLRFL